MFLLRAKASPGAVCCGVIVAVAAAKQWQLAQAVGLIAASLLRLDVALARGLVKAAPQMPPRITATNTPKLP
jgi:hypothetical protein